MKEIVIWIFLSGILFIVFITLFLAGIVKKKRVLIILSILSLLLAIGSGSRTGYLLVSKSFNRLDTSMFKPRTGKEIYAALFGTPNNCVKVINQQDQVIPKIDYAIWLQFETCPEELIRVLKTKSYQIEKQSTKTLMHDSLSLNDNWFKPKTLGDSVWVFNYQTDDYRSVQTIYTSLDSTKAFCIDILD